MGDNRVPYPQVGISIVAYLPQAQSLRRLLDAVVGQVSFVVLVDNGGALGALGDEYTGRVVIVDPGVNLGVAAAHNRALAHIFAAGCSHALLFDQDSVPQSDLVGELLRVEHSLLDHGYAVGAVGAKQVAPVGEHVSGFIHFSGLWRQICSVPDTELPVPACECNFLITSGTLLRREIFEKVGPFAECLFIDNVDLEWCFRASSLGYRLYGAVDATMQHEIGDRSLKIPFLRKKRFAIHSPVRIYFMTRNRLLLYRLSHIPLGWKIADFPRMLMKIFIFSLLVPPRLSYVRLIVAGLLDGLRGRGGPARKAP